MLSDVLKTVHSGPIPVVVPKIFSHYDFEVEGEIYLNPSGYLYSAGSRTVVWCKFLALSIYIPVYAVACKCINVFRQIIGESTHNFGSYDFQHMKHLASIAWRAVAQGPSQIMERVEEFAFAEIAYNGRTPDTAVKEIRSSRLKDGFYLAQCMQPLFHKDQCLFKPSDLKSRIVELEKEYIQLQESISRSNGFWLTSAVKSLFSPTGYEELDSESIGTQMANCAIQIKKLKELEQESLRAHKYAYQAVLSANSFSSGARNQLVKTEEVDCCGYVVYRDETICGLVHKVDICALRFWAINCLCFSCCIWPDCLDQERSIEIKFE